MRRAVVMGGLVVAASVLASGWAIAQDNPQPPQPSDRPSNLAPPTRNPSREVTTDELNRFARVYPQLVRRSERASTEIDRLFASEDITLADFIELQAEHRPVVNHQAESETTDATQSGSGATGDGESRNGDYARLNAEVLQIRQALESDMQVAVRQEGLSVERFQEIYAAISRQPQLQQAFQRRMQSVNREAEEPPVADPETNINGED